MVYVSTIAAGRAIQPSAENVEARAPLFHVLEDTQTELSVAEVNAAAALELLHGPAPSKDKAEGSPAPALFEVAIDIRNRVIALSDALIRIKNDLG